MDERELLRMLEEFRRAAEAQDAEALDAITRAYSKLYNRLADLIELELRRLWTAGGDNISRAFVAQRLSDLKSQIADELTKFSGYLETALPAWADNAMILGGEHSAELLNSINSGTISLDFNRLPKEAINTILGFMQKGSPLYDRIGQISPYYSEVIIDKLVEAIALGYNPRKAAGLIEPFISGILYDAKSIFASPLADALRLARTVQLWTYREATRANYAANSDIVTGWQWSASLDPNTCASCWAMHGTIHPLDEPLDDHHNGRCAMIPVIMGEAFITQTGEQAFNKLTEEQQKQILGAGKFEAWKNNQFTFDQLSQQKTDEVWGTMRTETPLKDLINEQKGIQ